MGTWFVGAKSIEKIYPAEEAMRSYPAECDDLGKDRWVAFLRSEGRWDDESCGVLEHPKIFFDGGGMIHRNEPLLSWEANNCRMKTYVRQLPFLLEEFQHLKLVEAFPDVVGFGGFCRKYFLSPKTVTQSIKDMKRLLRGTESLRQELEMDMHKALNKTVHAASLRKCGCMSGKMYGDCCGKHIESREHRDRRKAISES